MNKVKLFLAVLTISLSSLSSTVLSADMKEGSLAFAKCEEYINVRTEANTNSEIVAVLYNNHAATIVKVLNNGWYKIKSGNIKGYVNSEFIITGDEAKLIADEVGYQVAIVKSDSLNVRTEPNEKSEVICSVEKNDELEVIEVKNNWISVVIDSSIYGFVSLDYCDLKTYYPIAIPIEELELTDITNVSENESNHVYPNYIPSPVHVNVIKNDIENEEELISINENIAYATCNEEMISDVYEDIANDVLYDNYMEDCTDLYDYEYQDEYYDYYNDYYAEYIDDSYHNYYIEDSYVDYSDFSQNYIPGESGVDGQAIVDYALQFVGNPYVCGGTSLTNGADCSGFTQSVYNAYGIDINRVAADQATGGMSVGLDDIQAGDLLFYSDDSGISHVAIYAGGGSIVHAATEEQGIVVGDAFYDTPVSAVRYW